jgi:thiamine pyrophosphokinase
MDTILIFAGGDLPDAGIADELPTADLVVAADSGYDAAEHLGFRVDVLVGDLDSIVAAPIPRHVLVERHPVDKDQTDLDLALELAIREAGSTTRCPRWGSSALIAGWSSTSWIGSRHVVAPMSCADGGYSMAMWERWSA